MGSLVAVRTQCSTEGSCVVIVVPAFHHIASEKHLTMLASQGRCEGCLILRSHLQGLRILLAGSPVNAKPQQPAQELHKGIAVSADKDLRLELCGNIQSFAAHSVHADACNGLILTVSLRIRAHIHGGCTEESLDVCVDHILMEEHLPPVLKENMCLVGGPLIRLQHGRKPRCDLGLFPDAGA